MLGAVVSRGPHLGMPAVNPLAAGVLTKRSYYQMLNTACVACLTVSFQHGLGKHDADLTFDQLVNIAKWTWMSVTPGIVCSIVARASIAILLVRIFGRKKWLKWSLIGITVLQIVSAVVLIIMSWVQVKPVEALWNPLIPAQRLSPDVVARTGNVTGGKFFGRTPITIPAGCTTNTYRWELVAPLARSRRCSCARRVRSQSNHNRDLHCIFLCHQRTPSELLCVASCGAAFLHASSNSSN